jgi:hypothetical protein
LREDGADNGVEKTCYLDHISVAPVPESYNLATRMLLAQKDALQAAGFRDMRLYANIQVGGYFWATLGLDWNREKISDTQLQIILNTIEGKMEEALARVDPNTTSDQQKDALQKTMLEWRALFSRETPPTPLEIARIGRMGPFFAYSKDPLDPKKAQWVLCQHKKEAEELTEHYIGQRQSYHLGNHLNNHGRKYVGFAQLNGDSFPFFDRFTGRHNGDFDNLISRRFRHRFQSLENWHTRFNQRSKCSGEFGNGNLFQQNPKNRHPQKKGINVFLTKLRFSILF